MQPSCNLDATKMQPKCNLHATWMQVQLQHKFDVTQLSLDAT